MTETRQDFEIYQGDTVKINDTVSDTDVTEYTVSFRMYDYKGGEKVLEKTDDDASVQIADQDTIEVILTGDDTSEETLYVSEKDEYYFRVIITDSSDHSYTVTTGNITVHE